VKPQEVEKTFSGDLIRVMETPELCYPDVQNAVGAETPRGYSSFSSEQEEALLRLHPEVEGNLKRVSGVGVCFRLAVRLKAARSQPKLEAAAGEPNILLLPDFIP
jgi:hypothetical protein